MKKIIFLLNFILFTFYIHAISINSKYIFINSTPIRAKVLIDGVDKGILTPCILRNIDPAQKTITVQKEGYKEKNILISLVKTNKLDLSLTPNSFDLYFPESSLYSIGNTETKGPVYVSKLKSGNYNISISKDKIKFSKASPFLPVEVGLGTSLVLSLASMFATIGISSWSSQQATLNSGDEFLYQYHSSVRDGVDIGKYATISISSVLALAFTSVLIVDLTTRNYSKNQKMEIENKYPTDRGKNLYETSSQFLSIGEINKSINVLHSLISLYPNSDYIPHAYYQLGSNYYILKDYNNALNNWNIFINEYPLADYYDYVLKNISEIYYLRKDYSKAINMLNKVVFTENLLDRETIFAFKARLDLEIFLKTKKNEYYKFAESDYLTLIEESASSEQIDYYYSQLIKLYNINGDSDKLSMLKKKAKSIQDSSTRELILSYFE